MIKSQLPLFLLLLLFSLLTLPNLLKQNIIGDESVYILEGDRYTHAPNSFYNNSGSPHLLKLLTGSMIYSLPLYRDYTPYFEKTSTNVYTSADFIYKQNTQFAQQIIILTRIPHFILALILGAAIFLFTQKYFSTKAATIALTLYVTNATILAQTPTSNLDLGTTAFTFFASISFYYFIHNYKPKTKATQSWQEYFPPIIVLTGILLGLAQVTKISAILLYPFFLIYFVLIRYTQKIHHTYRHLITIFAISFITLWATYGFSIGPIILPTDDPIGIQKSVLSKIPIISSFVPQVTDFLRLPIFPAGAYFNNFTYQLTHGYLGHTVYLNAEFTENSWWYFIPTLFFIKHPLTFFALITLALYTMAKLSKKEIYQQSFLLLFIVITALWSVTSSLQLGVRYIMPALPFLFIWIGINISHWLDKNAKNKTAQHLVIATIALYALSSILYYPNFFAFRNEISRFIHPVNQLSDSDYDWGQNVYLLGPFQKQNNLYPLYFKSFSGANHAYYGIQNDGDPIEAFIKRKPGYYTFSHSALVSLKHTHPDIFTYFSFHSPQHTIGENIYIYKIPPQ